MNRSDHDALRARLGVDGAEPVEVVEMNPDVLEQLRAEEAELGLEYVGRDSGSNRVKRRDLRRLVARLTRRPDSWQTLHVMGDQRLPLTPTGVKRLARRRARAKAGHESRRVNQRGAR